jgi:hypothetical protein
VKTKNLSACVTVNCSKCVDQRERGITCRSELSVLSAIDPIIQTKPRLVVTNIRFNIYSSISKEVLYETTKNGIRNFPMLTKL